MAAFSAIFHLLLALFLPLLSSPSMAQTHNNITLGSSLSAVEDGSSSPWLSPSGEFAFGFRRIDDTDLFLIAIWFNKIPDKTIVWYANGDNPAQRGSTIELTTNGFSLKDPQGQEIWVANLIATTGIAYAAMLDNGNFVIVSNSVSYTWESFRNPTDTISPSQVMEKGAIVTSRLSATNYTKGRFEFRMLQDGNLVLNTKGWPTDSRYKAYYSSNTLGEGERLAFNESGDMYIEKSKGGILNLALERINPIKDGYYRTTLDFNGVLTQYTHPRASNGKQSWSIVGSMPDNICINIFDELGSGACGFNSYCELISRRPKCGCPPGYTLVDPADVFSGCRPKFILGCEVEDGSKEAGDIFYFEEVRGLNWPTGDYEHLNLYTEQECKTSCLNDCFCAVAVFGNGCWKKKLPLSNGRFNIPEQGKALIKVRNDDPLLRNPYPPNSGNKKDQKKLIRSLLVGGSLLVITFLLLATISVVVVFLIYHKKASKIKRGSSSSGTNLLSFTYKELEEATDGFKEELGRGSFGIVYKGVLLLELESRNFVAVKKLDKVVQEGEKEFKAEVNAIGKTHHKNLVQLLGFCQEGTQRLLVYEFMSNGTLARFLFGISRPDWIQRIQIAIDIARGLVYLHEECKTQIIHCDIKPQNILLDDGFTARISDFGLAKLLMANQTRTCTGIRGTRGYVAPEWFRNKPVTVKVDVYSYGVMLLEIISCRKSVEMEVGGEEKAILTDWAYDCYRKGTLKELVDDDPAALNDMNRVQRWVIIAIWCIQEDPSLRPTMKRVTQMLEGIVDVSVPPCAFSFSQQY